MDLLSNRRWDSPRHTTYKTPKDTQSSIHDAPSACDARHNTPLTTTNNTPTADLHQPLYHNITTQHNIFSCRPREGIDRLTGEKLDRVFSVTRTLTH
jgi:hypothetical protein